MIINKEIKVRLNLLFIGMALLVMLGLSSSLLSAQTTVNVSTLAELRMAVQKSDQHIIMKPGKYNITVLPDTSRYFPCSGNNNIIEMTGVYIDFPVGSSREGHFQISGNNNTLRGGEFENTYKSGLKQVTDFVAYNKDRDNLAYGCDPHIALTGNGNTVVGIKMTVRGSFPYGYGSYFGIGRGNVYGLSKRGGIAVQGPNNTIDNCELQMQAFGHGIYLQKAADNTLIKNTLIEGVVRATNDLLAEKEGSLPYQNDYKDNNGNVIQPNTVYSLCEDGIRTYRGGGSVTVENCTVKKMRGGIRLYLEQNARVINTKAIDCGATNFNMPNGGKVINSFANFAYAPLSDFRLSRNNIEAEWTIIPSPHAIGNHNLADVLGNNQKIVFHRTPGTLDSNLRPIVVSGNNSVIRNETEYPVILKSSASGNLIYSYGPVTDNGTDNKVIQIDNTYAVYPEIEVKDNISISGK
jgi:parallel beta-helix repeat protein